MTNKHTQLHQDLETCETGVWSALVHGDITADKDALHPDFLGVYADGFTNKAEHVQQLENGPTVKTFRLFDVRVLALGHDHAVISYRAEFQRTDHQSFETMYVSSIWQRKNRGWINIFSQDTPAAS